MLCRRQAEGSPVPYWEAAVSFCLFALLSFKHKMIPSYFILEAKCSLHTHFFLRVFYGVCGLRCITEDSMVTIGVANGLI